MAESSLESRGGREASSDRPGLVALLVGIDGYDCAEGSPFDPLSCATNDVVSLAETLGRLWEPQYRLTSNSLVRMKREGRPKSLIRALERLADQSFPSRELLHDRLCKQLGEADLQSHIPVVSQEIQATRFVSLTALVLPKNDRNRSTNHAIEQLQQTWGVEVACGSEHLTNERIIQAVTEAAQVARPSDTLLFFLAGHGQLLDGQPCLVTIDDSNDTGVGWLKIADLQAAVDNCPARDRVLILDCCQTADAQSQTFFEALSGLASGWSVLVSCSPGEASFEDTVKGDSTGKHSEQGIFTSSLVSGLMGGAHPGGDEPIGLLELANYVCQRVEVESKLLIQSHATRKRSTAASAALLRPQHPVLLSSKALALGGNLRVVLAPSRAWSKQDLRRPWPSPAFTKYVKQFLFGNWPINFSRKTMFRECGALLYAGAMLLTFLWFLRAAPDEVRVPLALTAAIGSASLWWFMVLFAVAANEDGWHSGGYANGILIFAWHGLLFLGYRLAADITDARFAQHSLFLFVDLFVLAFIVLAFGCNASQAIIALAETVRRDQRQEIRQAVRIFRQFRSRRWQVDIFNLIAMVSARPDVYFLAFLVVLGLVGLDLVHVGMRFSEDPQLWLIVLRDIFVAVFACWQAFWYSAAFQFIQREVDRR